MPPSTPDPTADPPATPPRRPPGTFPIARIGGTQILVSYSWFAVALMIAVLVAPQIQQAQAGLGWSAYLLGGLFAVLLYASVLLHEGSHAIAARRCGFTVDAVVLHFLGGMTTMRGEAKRPRDELFIAIVGPLTSLAIGVGALLGALLLPDGLVRLALFGLAGANLLLGVLNLVPGLPLDGGRVLKAAVWSRTGNPHQATVVAGQVGRAIAALSLTWPLWVPWLFDEDAQLLDYLLAAIVAAFLWTGATAAIHMARLRSKLPGLVATELARRTIVVPETVSVAEALRRADGANAGAMITSNPSGDPVGVVSGAAIRAVPEQRRAWVDVATTARTIEPDITLAADLHGEELVVAISRTPASEFLLVASSGDPVGVLVTDDVDAAFRKSH